MDVRNNRAGIRIQVEMDEVEYAGDTGKLDEEGNEMTPESMFFVLSPEKAKELVQAILDLVLEK